MKRILNNLIILFLVFSIQGFTQQTSGEIVTELTVNPVLMKKYHELKENKMLILSSVTDTINLPFLDDFSKESIYPDTSRWIDKQVFINRDYPITPVTIGVATFDGVGESGAPDFSVNSSVASNPSDTLTSKPIKLNVAVSDSVYFSFFWQAKGRGNDPENSDTLLLQFKNPTTGLWKTIWYMNGYDPVSADTIFRLVMIPVIDTTYLKTGFQFRFTNYATTSGNIDHWHIDYILLDKQRSASDTIFDDVSFVYNSRSLLKNYQAMPWEQYAYTDMKTDLKFFIRNNNTVTKNTSFNYSIYNNTGGTEATYSGGNANIDPFIPNGYCNYSPISNPQIGNNIPPPFIAYSYPTLNDTASFTMECVINTTPDEDRVNDTLRYTQKFLNYFAYDDGTAEAGYGINVGGGQLAYKFTLNSPDTIVAVQMLFNWIVTNVTQRNFRIILWNDDGGMPGTIILMDSMVTPNYQYEYHPGWGNQTNDFYTYKLTSPKVLSGIFYVGWIQYTTDLLNIGLDRNINSNDKMFYNISNKWTQSVIPGSWMIRPVFRDTNLFASVQNISVPLSDIKVFPNPSSGKFQVAVGSNSISKYNLEIYNVIGKKVYESISNFGSVNNYSLSSGEQRCAIDISVQPAGIYFLFVSDTNGNSRQTKVILSK
ncbi:MAG: T9SS type A sorting domain-containing protein [Bacteroidota bacterium]